MIERSTITEIESAGVALRPVPGHIGYAAGSDGNVYSFHRRGLRPRQTPGEARGVNVSTTLLARPGNVRGNGYRYLSLRRTGGGQRLRNIACILAESFNGQRPLGMDVSHVDGNPLNNQPGNLVYESRSENLKRAVYNHGTMRPPKTRLGEDNNKAKLTEDQVREIRREAAHLVNASTATDRRLPHGSARALASRFGIYKTSLRDIVNRRTWRHVED